MVADKEIARTIAAHKKQCPEADEQVLGFIFHMLYDTAINDKDVEAVNNLFRAGYCYHFATILENVFNRGEVCWAAPFSHIVWVDTNNVPYDCEGVYFSEAKYYIPIDFIRDAIKSFKHIPGVEFYSSADYIDDAIRRWEYYIMPPSERKPLALYKNEFLSGLEEIFKKYGYTEVYTTTLFDGQRRPGIKLWIRSECNGEALEELDAYVYCPGESTYGNAYIGKSISVENMACVYKDGVFYISI